MWLRHDFGVDAKNFMEAALGPDAVNKIRAILRVYPEGLTSDRMKDFGFSDSKTMNAALRVLQENGEVWREGETYFSSVYKAKGTRR